MLMFFYLLYYVLVLNCGSLSLKFVILDVIIFDEVILGLVECFGLDMFLIKYKYNGEKKLIEFVKG